MNRLARFFDRVRARSLQARYEDFSQGRRLVDNVDAPAAARSNHGMDPFGGAAGGIPPDSLDGYDEGRPRH
jgi:hypothetical protein